ncbi:hypothetical protein D3C71_1910070 [compost metagenome]
MCVAGTLFLPCFAIITCSRCVRGVNTTAKELAKVQPFCSNQLLDTEIIAKKQLFLLASTIFVALGAKGCLSALIPFVELFTPKISVFSHL